MAVDELPDAGDGEGDFRVHNAEVKVQMDAHSLEPRDDLLEVHPCLVHHQLPHTPPGSLQLISNDPVTHERLISVFMVHSHENSQKPFSYTVFLHLYLLIEDYMERESMAEGLQINGKGCRVHWLKTPQQFACKARQRV